jgi:hypothetical protein
MIVERGLDPTLKYYPLMELSKLNPSSGVVDVYRGVISRLTRLNFKLYIELVPGTQECSTPAGWKKVPGRVKALTLRPFGRTALGEPEMRPSENELLRFHPPHNYIL